MKMLLTPESRNSGARGDFIYNQQFHNQVSAATDTQTTIKELLGTAFSILCVQSGYKEDFNLESAFEFRSSK